ncbi:MAG TPA: S1/P1 nuclease [Cyclobacteriaceae bacterium]|nr:S1/P1 nuclease [Cyclobacteriaceae bacterium]
MRPLFTTLLIMVFVCQSFGWGPTGHRVTGMIASNHLNKKAKKKIETLLGQESLAMVSTWMDEVRSDSTYNYASDFHWVTVETGQTYEQSKKNPHGDVIMTIERLIAELKSGKLDRMTEIQDLKFLVHLIGDMHQPLHVGCCDDSGGNKVQVKWFGGNSNLHRVWDSDIIDGTKLSYTEFAQSLGTPDEGTVRRLQSGTIRDWANESMNYRKQMYDIGNGSLGYEYSYKNLPLVRERLLAAGVRLAGVLNDIYGK